MTIEFLYFNSCPNSAQTLENLRTALSELDVDEEPQVVDVDPATFDRPFLGSPSVVVNGVDLYAQTRPESFEFACRTFDIDGEKTGVLSAGFIRDRLKTVLGI